MWATMWIVVWVVLVLFNAVCVGLVALQLPGAWLMLLATSLAAWWQWGWGWPGFWDEGTITPVTLIVLLVLATLGEVLEFVAGAAGARQAGASKRATLLAIVGGVAGAIVGTATIPVPVVGTLVGAALGAGLGSLGGDLWAGREWGPAVTAGKGAAIGRFWGAVSKLAVAAAMWLVVLGAVLWP